MSSPKKSKAAEIVGSNDDLLTKILLLLPIKSLLRFKSVSKHWLHLLSDPRFCTRRCPSWATASGLFLARPPFRHEFPGFQFIDLNCLASSIRSLPLASKDPNRTGISILQACNGLFLCCSYFALGFRRPYRFVYNPTTHHYVRLPLIPSRRDDPVSILGLSLAFDPRTSPHYKVVCVSSSGEKNTSLRIHIYSSSSDHRVWRRSTKSSFPAGEQTLFHQGIFWNGSVHWIRPEGKSSPYFKVDEELLSEMPMPPVPDHLETDTYWSMDYFGVSGDRLHYVYNRYLSGERFCNVYELEKDYSGWSVKHRVDVSGVSKVWSSYRKTVLCVVRCEVEEESYLVMSIPGEILKYNFQNKTFLKICDSQPYPMERTKEFVYKSSDVHQYTESLARVLF